MAESTLSHLNYGHAGTATFDIDSCHWSFARQFATRRLHQIKIRNRNSIDAIPAPIQFPSSTISTRFTDANASAKALLQIYPQLFPASDLLPELSATSAAILSAAQSYDPLVGSLYSTGSVTYASRSDIWENPRRIAATVTGEAANVLRLAFLHKEVMGWEGDKSVWIRGDTLRNTESGYWNEEAAPIQQVCFAQSEDRSSLLAVRLPTKTVIFRPFYSQRPEPARPSSHYHLPPSLIDPHPVLTLGSHQTGGSPHADVTFNPDFQLQFAVVDQSHFWSVWDLERGRKTGEYNLSCFVQGHVVPPEDTNPSGEDGWARVLWVGDVNTIMVCNRRHLSIIDITGGSFQYLSCPALISKRSSDWILDVQRHPLLRGRFFVLTSTELLLMAVTTASEARNVSAGPVGARILLSWKHYRGMEDFTLSICVQMLDENEFCVLLRSRLNDLTQVYNFTISSLVPTAFASSASPTLLDITVDAPGHTLQITMESCVFQGDLSSNNLGSGRQYIARGLRFFKLFMLRSDLSVHESILYATSPLIRGEGNEATIRNVSWTRAYRPRHDVRTVRKVQEMDDFVELEGMETLEVPVSKLASQVPKVVEGKEMDTARRVVNHRTIYDALLQRRSTGIAAAELVDIPTVVKQLAELLTDSTDLSQLPISTLLEFAAMKIDVSDVDEASASLQELRLLATEDGTHEARCIADAYLLYLDETAHPTMSGLYDSILQSWIAPLPRDVPHRIRQHKERLARRVAAEVMLASTRILHREPQPSTEEIQPGTSQGSAISVPILSSQPLDSSQSRLPSSQTLPTPPLSRSETQPPASQSSVFPSSQTHALEQPSLLEATPMPDSLSRLRKHLKFKEDSESQSSIPDSVDQLLRHWQPGVDPRTYDWNAAELANRADVVDEASQQQLEKARKKKERRERKQRREDELAQALPSSQPFVFAQPTGFPRSSPGPMLGGVNSSQAPRQPFPQVPLPGSGSQSQEGFGPFVAQSQVEPGKFGGRPDKKKKKKGRVVGF